MIAINAYLVLITWPDGTEGLLFPRPGNVPIADDILKGERDFDIAKSDLEAFSNEGGKIKGKSLDGTIIRLVRFERGSVLKEHIHQPKEQHESNTTHQSE